MWYSLWCAGGPGSHSFPTPAIPYGGAVLPTLRSFADAVKQGSTEQKDQMIDPAVCNAK